MAHRLRQRRLRFDPLESRCFILGSRTLSTVQGTLSSSSITVISHSSLPKISEHIKRHAFAARLPLIAPSFFSSFTFSEPGFVYDPTYDFPLFDPSVAPSLDIRVDRFALYSASGGLSCVLLHLQMPVPVPRASQPPAHPVHKHSKTEDASKSSSFFHHLKHTLPVSPTGPPPPFGSRDQWIKSLPSWRRTKTRRILEDDAYSTPQEQNYQQGLTSAADAHVIKGNHAEACLLPMNAFLQNGVNPPSVPGDLNQQMYVDHIKSSWSTARFDTSTQGYLWPQVDNAFAPVLEDDSEDMINGDLGSSPIGPMTPFADYVDRAVATSDLTTLSDIPLKQEDIQSLCHGLQCYDVIDYQYADPIKQEPVAPVNDSAPSASTKYKKFAEPMADWIVSYVWKVCNNSIALPAAVSKYTYVILLSETSE